MKVKVLILDDDPAIQRLLLRQLSKGGYQVERILPDQSLIDEIAEQRPGLLICTGFENYSEVRRSYRHLPIIALTDTYDHKHIAHLLDLGADDCVTKPFSIFELEARIRALLRRAQGTSLGEHALECVTSKDGYLHMDIANHQVSAGGNAVQLTRTEFALLKQFMANAEKVLTHRQLLQAVWGLEYGDESDYLRVFVHQLRTKVEPDPEHPAYIVTEARVGYAFRAPVAARGERPPRVTGATQER